VHDRGDPARARPGRREVERGVDELRAAEGDAIDPLAAGRGAGGDLADDLLVVGAKGACEF
jgi:hypothetical protein